MALGGERRPVVKKRQCPKCGIVFDDFDRFTSHVSLEYVFERRKGV